MLENRIAAPVEIAVLEFPGRRFDGEIVPTLAELVDDGIVTILDLRLVTKDVDGSVAMVESGALDGVVAAAVAELGAASARAAVRRRRRQRGRVAQPRELGRGDRLGGHLGPAPRGRCRAPRAAAW